MTTTPESTPSQTTVSGFVINNVEDAEKIAEALERVRPLDDTQRSNLLDILHEDSVTAERKIREAFQEERNRVAREAAESVPEPVDATEVFRAEAEALVKAYSKGMRRLAKKAKKSGVTVRGPWSLEYASDPAKGIVLNRANVDEHRSAVRKAVEEATAPLDLALDKAVGLIQDQRAQANRQIRLAAVSKDAAAILHTLPDVDSIIQSISTAVDSAKAEIEQAAKDGRPLNVLMSKARGLYGKDKDGFETSRERQVAEEHSIHWDFNTAENRYGFYSRRTGRWDFYNWRTLVNVKS